MTTAQADELKAFARELYTAMAVATGGQYWDWQKLAAKAFEAAEHFETIAIQRINPQDAVPSEPPTAEPPSPTAPTPDQPPPPTPVDQTQAQSQMSAPEPALPSQPEVAPAVAAAATT